MKSCRQKEQNSKQQVNTHAKQTDVIGQRLGAVGCCESRNARAHAGRPATTHQKLLVVRLDLLPREEDEVGPLDHRAVAVEPAAGAGAVLGLEPVEVRERQPGGGLEPEVLAAVLHRRSKQ